MSAIYRIDVIRDNEYEAVLNELRMYFANCHENALRDERRATTKGTKAIAAALIAETRRAVELFDRIVIRVLDANGDPTGESYTLAGKNGGV